MDGALNLVDGVRAGETRAIARLMSMAEGRPDACAAEMAEIHRMAGRAHIVGLTGVPGSGKSTLLQMICGTLNPTAGSIKIRDSADVLLAQVPLSDPCGSVNGTTGQLAFSIAGTDASADASGTAAYGEFCDSAGLVHLSLPAQAGSAAVSGKIVLNTLSIVAGGPVAVLTATIG